MANSSSMRWPVLRRAIGGGNLVLHAESQAAGLAAAVRAADAVASLAGVIAPFPGGICRSGSKIGSRYENLIASTDEAYCPTLRDEIASRDVASQLVEGATCGYEIVIDGVDLAAVRGAMRAAIEAAAGPGVLGDRGPQFWGQIGEALRSGCTSCLPNHERARRERRGQTLRPQLSALAAAC